MKNLPINKLLTDEQVLKAYQDYHMGKERLYKIAIDLGVTVHYLHRHYALINVKENKEHITEQKINDIRMHENKLIERAMMLAVGKGSIEDYREHLFYVCKANAHSNYNVQLPKHLI